MDIHWISQSHLFELARRGKRLTHILAVIPLVFAFSFVAGFGALPVAVVLFMKYGIREDFLSMNYLDVTAAGFWMALFLITSFVLIYVFVGLWVYFFEDRPFWTLGYERRQAVLRYARGFLAGLVMFAGAVGILAVSGAIRVEPQDSSRQGAAAIWGVLLVLAGWIIQGGGEEIVERGWALPVIGARIRPWVGVVVSSLIFAALHGLNEHLSILALVNLALFGVFAALYALREGSIWGISALHSAWNWIQGNVFGFQVSGMAGGGGSLLNLAGGGPQWLSGGLFGPEGGAAVSAVLAVGIAVLLLWPKRKNENQPVEV